MTTPPPGITVRAHMTLPQVARAAAALIDAAAAAGLTPPSTLNAHDYGHPAATLYLSATRTPAIWEALQEWASHYHTEIDTHPSSTPGTIHASVAFRAAGIRYEVTAVITDDDIRTARNEAPE
jgi:hypothetical protein